MGLNKGLNTNNGLNKNNSENLTPEILAEMYNVSEEISKGITENGVMSFLSLYPELSHLIIGIQSHQKIAQIICKNLTAESVFGILTNKMVNTSIRLEILEEIENTNLFEINKELLKSLENQVFEYREIGELAYIYSKIYKKSFVLFKGKKKVINGNLSNYDKKEYIYTSNYGKKYNKFGQEKN